MLSINTVPATNHTLLATLPHEAQQPVSAAHTNRVPPKALTNIAVSGANNRLLATIPREEQQPISARHNHTTDWRDLMKQKNKRSLALSSLT